MIDYGVDLQYEDEIGGGGDYVDDSSASLGLKHWINDSYSSAGKLFVGGISWETTEESFSRYFSKYGEIIDTVIMMDKVSGRPRGFGFVTFVDAEVASKVLQEHHVIDGRVVEVKRTVPREETMPHRRVSKTKKIFVGGIPHSLTEGELMENFSSYGNIIDCQILLDHNTARSRGFAFVTFHNEDAVEKVLSDGYMHELGGKQVEIKRAEPKRAGVDHPSESRMRHSGGCFNNVVDEYGPGYSGEMGKGYGGYGSYSGYGNYMGNYGMSSAGYYNGYGGYGFGFGYGGPMYGASGYVGNNYGYNIASGYGGGAYRFGGEAKGYGGYGSARGYGNNGAASGRFHPYRK